MNETTQNDPNHLVVQIAMLLEAAEQQSKVNAEQSEIIAQQRKQITAQIEQHEKNVQTWTEQQQATLDKMAKNQKIHFTYVDDRLDSATTAIPVQIENAIGLGIGQTAKTVVGAVQSEVKLKIEPLIGQINSTAQSAEKSKIGLNVIIQSLRWKMFAMIALLGGIIALLYGCAVFGLLAWERNQVDTLRTEKATLTSALDSLSHRKDQTTTYDGHKIIFATCGDKPKSYHACILVRSDLRWGTGQDGSYYAVPVGD